MKQSAVVLILVAAVGGAPSLAYGLTPAQSAEAAAKTSTEMSTRLNAQAMAKAAAERLARKKAESVLKAKIKVISTRSVRSEVRLRNDAAMKAAMAQERIAARAPDSVGRVPGKGNADLGKNKKHSLRRLDEKRVNQTRAVPHPASHSK
jgi:hypothetical protein